MRNGKYGWKFKMKKKTEMYNNKQSTEAKPIFNSSANGKWQTIIYLLHNNKMSLLHRMQGFLVKYINFLATMFIFEVIYFLFWTHSIHVCMRAQQQQHSSCWKWDIRWHGIAFWFRLICIHGMPNHNQLSNKVISPNVEEREKEIYSTSFVYQQWHVASEQRSLYRFLRDFRINFRGPDFLLLHFTVILP